VITGYKIWNSFTNQRMLKTHCPVKTRLEHFLNSRRPRHTAVGWKLWHVFSIMSFQNGHLIQAAINKKLCFHRQICF
jgi:hypothetical protein